MVADLTAVDHPADNISLGRLRNFQTQLAVVDQHDVPRFELLRQVRIGNGASRSISFDRSRRQRKRSACRKLRFAVRKISRADLRALGIQHHGRRQSERVPHAAEQVDRLAVTFMIAVRKIDSGDIHARKEHFPEHVFLGGRRSQGTYDFCFSHACSVLLFLILFIGL